MHSILEGQSTEARNEAARLRQMAAQIMQQAEDEASRVLAFAERVELEALRLAVIAGTITSMNRTD